MGIGEQPTREPSEPIEVMGPATIAAMDQHIEFISNLLRNSVGYQVTITTRSATPIDGNNLFHNFALNNFHPEDMIRSHGKCENVLDEEYRKIKKQQE